MRLHLKNKKKETQRYYKTNNSSCEPDTAAQNQPQTMHRHEPGCVPRKPYPWTDIYISSNLKCYSCLDFLPPITSKCQSHPQFVGPMVVVVMMMMIKHWNLLGCPLFPQQRLANHSPEVGQSLPAFPEGTTAPQPRSHLVPEPRGGRPRSFVGHMDND